jgi:hypothetical protein
MLDRLADPRTEDTLVYELLSTPAGGTEPQVVGRAIFRGGRSKVEAPGDIKVAVEEQLAQAFVDRLQADERPRGYRRTGRGIVDMLVPGMPEHFIARLRGLWLSYPDGSVVTAREALPDGRALAVQDVSEVGPPVTDPSIRRSTLMSVDQVLGTSPLVRSHPPETGIRPVDEAPLNVGPVDRTDCGWIV